MTARSSSKVLVSGLAVVLCLVASLSFGQEGLPGGETRPVAEMLNPDGTLNLSTGFSGSLSLAGYRMVTGANGEPRFVAGDGENGASKMARKVASPESDPSDVYWDDQFGLAGADDTVYAMVADGLGNIYIGGRFTAAGNVAANYVAKWDGTSWSAVGTGFDGYVSVLAVSGSDLYAGGNFTTAGGVSAPGIARWNGSTWSALGSGVNGPIQALAVSGSDVYAGGNFTTAGGVSAPGIARWNGSTWSALGSGVNGPIQALAVSGSDVYAGGSFTTAGGVTANYIARWNGTSWSALGTGMDSAVGALAVSGSDLYAGGYFTTAGGVSANRIAKWNGSSWSPLGTGMNDWVSSLAVSGSDIYAGGAFTTAGGVSANYIARWNASTWSALGTGTGSDRLEFPYIPDVRALAVSGSDLYAGGYFTTAGGVGASHVARWNGTSWSAVGTGFDGYVSVLAVSGSDLYAGGEFTGTGGENANRIAKWNGTEWSTLGTGVNGRVTALAVSGSDLYAGGDFTTAGGVSANRIAKWNGTTWSALGAGMNDTVRALAVSGTDLYAGGDFTTAGGVSASCIARWDGTTWSALGSGMAYGIFTPRVHALVVIGSNLYAGGEFSRAGGVSVNHIARWDGTEWSALGPGMWASHEPLGVFALAVSGSDLYAGGDFSVAGGVSANRIAKWNGVMWSALGTGIRREGLICRVNALAVSGSHLYAGGFFSEAGGVSANDIAKWDGTSWSALGTGMGEDIWSGDVNALAVSGDALFAGGEFTIAGSKVSGYFALWQPRVNVSTVQLSAAPGATTLGDDVYGFYKPALITDTGTTVSYPGGLPVDVTMERAPEIQVSGNRVNGAFTLTPDGVTFGGTGAALRVEFSEDDVALFGGSYTYFRAVRLVYPPGYPASKEAVEVSLMSDSTPIPWRIENGGQIYKIEIPFTEIGSTYGAVPEWLVTGETDIDRHVWETYR